MGIKHGDAGLFSEKPEALYAELTERPKAATSSYSATGDFLQYVYSVLVTKNHQKIRSSLKILNFTNFPSQIFFNDINQGYRAALLQKNSLWLIPFYMAEATYCYHEKV